MSAISTGLALLSDRCDLVDVALFGRHGVTASASGLPEVEALQAHVAKVMAHSAEVARVVPELAQCRALAAQVRPFLHRSQASLTQVTAQLDAIVAARAEVEAMARQLAYVEHATRGIGTGGVTGSASSSLMDTDVPPELVPRLAALEATFAALALEARAQTDAVDDVLETYEAAVGALSDVCGRWEGPLREAEARAMAGNGVVAGSGAARERRQQ